MKKLPGGFRSSIILACLAIWAICDWIIAFVDKDFAISMWKYFAEEVKQNGW